MKMDDRQENLCVLGIGDCGSTAVATVTNVNDTLNMTTNTFNQLNSTTNSAVANTIMNTASSNGASIVQTQNIDLSNMKIAGKIVISGGSQTQQAALSFEGVNQTKLTTDAQQSFLQNALTQLTNNTDSATIAKMDANAAAAVKQSAFTTASADTESNVNNIIKTTNITNNATNITQLFANNIVNNLTNDTINKCVSSISQGQTLNLSGSSGASVEILNFSQNQGAEMMASCKNLTDSTQKILNETMSQLGVTVSNTTTNTSTGDQSGKAAAETVNKGVIESVGDAITDIIGSITGPYAMISGAVVLVLSICCCLCILLCCGASALVMFKSKS